MFLKVKRESDTWKFYWKTEYVEPWNLLTTLNFPMGDHDIGIGVKTFDLTPLQGSQPAQAYFDFLSIMER